MMLDEDKTIFEYRMEKEKKYCDMIKNETLKAAVEKISYFTKDCGYIDGYVYRPRKYDPKKKLPVVFNFHGGGMVLKYCQQDGKYCQEIAEEIGVAVVNVDYAVAPEFKFPLPVLSSYDFIVQVLKNSETHRFEKDNLVLMGHSAGGYISAALCVLNSQKEKIKIKGLIADYAVLRQDSPPSTRSIKNKDKAIPVSRMEQYSNWYFGCGANTSDPLASPINAPGNSFPDSLIISADYDALKKEEKEFAEKLSKAGVEVIYKNFENTMHGFTHQWFDEFNEEQADKAWKMMQQFISSKLFETIDIP